MELPQAIITSLQVSRSITLTLAHFFTPVGEIGFALHEMFEVSGLTMEDLPYKEYIPSTEEGCSSDV